MAKYKSLTVDWPIVTFYPTRLPKLMTNVRARFFTTKNCSGVGMLENSLCNVVVDHQKKLIQIAFNVSQKELLEISNPWKVLSIQGSSASINGLSVTDDYWWDIPIKDIVQL